MNINNLIKRVKYRVLSPISYAKAIGVHLGDGVQITGKQEWTSEPYLIYIGDKTTVSKDVQFLTPLPQPQKQPQPLRKPPEQPQPRPDLPR